MSAEATGAEFAMVRVLDAPRTRVWQALTEAERLRQWWAPTGFTVFAATLDCRVGGALHCGMRSLDGYEMWAKFVYREIAAPQRLVFVNSFSNEAGGVTRHPIVATWPLETLTAITLEEEPDGKTRFTVRACAENAAAEERRTFDSSHLALRVAWSGMLDQLAACLVA